MTRLQLGQTEQSWLVILYELALILAHKALLVYAFSVKLQDVCCCLRPELMTALCLQSVRRQSDTCSVPLFPDCNGLLPVCAEVSDGKRQGPLASNPKSIKGAHLCHMQRSCSTKNFTKYQRYINQHRTGSERSSSSFFGSFLRSWLLVISAPPAGVAASFQPHQLLHQDQRTFQFLSRPLAIPFLPDILNQSHSCR